MSPAALHDEGRTSFDVPVLAGTMIEAARAGVAGRWPQLRALAGTELPRLAQAFADVAGLLASGTIDESRARRLVHLHQLAARSVLLTVDGLGLLTAEQAIHAGVRAAAKTVNDAVQFALL
jgi:hypothetical protein